MLPKRLLRAHLVFGSRFGLETTPKRGGGGLVRQVGWLLGWLVGSLVGWFVEGSGLFAIDVQLEGVQEVGWLVRGSR